MAEEITLSIEETNKLRAKIGLPPIPIPKASRKEDDVIELSLEETNKLRISIGLKPIPIESNQPKIRQDSETSNHSLTSRQKQDNKRAYEEEDSNKKTILDEAPSSTDDWLENLGKSKQEKPKKRPKLAKQVSESETTQNVKIGHGGKELRQLQDNDIFTLQDTEVGDDDEDVLTNEKLLQNAKLKRDLAEKREAETIKFSGRHHVTHDTDEESEDGDDEYLIQDKVVIGSSIALPEVKKKHVKNKPTISNLFEDLDSIDRKTSAAPIKMKKIKSKKKMKNQFKPRIIDEVEIKPVELSNIDVHVEDDYEQELQQALSSARKIKQKNRSHLNAEQIANEIAKSKRWQLENDVVQGDSFSRVYDETNEFLNNLDSSLLIKDFEKEIKQEQEHLIKQENEPLIKQENKPLIKQEDEPLIKQEGPESKEDEDEPKFNGIAETLKFLQSKNIIAEKSQQEKSQDLERAEATKQTELLKLKISIEERILRQELEKDSAYMRLPKNERATRLENELDKRLREKGIFIEEHHIRNGHRRKRDESANVKVENKLKLYNPKVSLTYKDNEGNVLDTKQAYKHLSHQYHGTGISKNKQNKLRKRIKEEPLEFGRNIL
ncbi:uncharacterized protein SPAPADRAFT_139388 [Spathaspora passalidarum NRRL Y-27907]|uniref:Uncharacterized protein n=1 Tax=Spathaspora passalidarum (strain NRRL Y-27907 / 11-Y1) TaxID=619300 RepID=G3APR0_SPAPN|nr:uncharacterized protein SPAPADRAFT_139388 [Spathaspora passalidarum NRRL Y-27907]EGW32231.1 hypothetical protein SPAPADRAFT_139388 [Spathaspora passalidarum NRRL Y-27907]